MSSSRPFKPCFTRPEVSRELASALGEELTVRLRGLAERTGKTPETIIDIGLEFVALGVRGLLSSPLRRTAQQMASKRWEGVTHEQRSEQLRRAARARWAKRNSGPSLS